MPTYHKSVNIRPLHALKLGANILFIIRSYHVQAMKGRFKNGKVSIIDPDWERAMMELDNLPMRKPG